MKEQSHKIISFEPGVVAALLALLILCAPSLQSTAQTQTQSAPELIVQRGPDNIWGMALSPDGRILATGGFHTALKIWDAVKGRELRAIATESDATMSVAFSPDGKVVANTAAGNNQSFVELWDVATGQKLRALRGHTDRVLAVAYAPDGRTLVTGSMDSTVKVWDAATGTELRTLAGHTHGVWSVAISRDGRLLATGGYDNSIKIWDLAKGKRLHTLEGHSANIPALAFSPDGQTVASGSIDASIRIWNVSKGKLLQILKGHTDAVSAVAFSPDGQILASGSRDRSLKLWNTTSWQEIRGLNTDDPGGLHAVIFSPDGRTLFSAGEGSIIRVSDVGTGAELRRISGYADTVNSIAFSPDGLRLLSGGGSNMLDKNISSRTTKLWRSDGGRELQTLSGHKSNVTSVVFSPTGKIFASAGWDHELKLWDAADNRELLTLLGHKNAINGIAFSPDGRFLASASGGPIKNVKGEPIAGVSEDNTIRLWDVQTGREVWKVEAHPIPISAIAFSPNGRLLASAANHGAADVAGYKLVPSLENLRELSKIRIWDVTSGRAVTALGDVDFYMPITTLTFSPDGQVLACGGYTNIITLWDITSGARLKTLRGHSGNVKALAYSPDGQTLASGSDDRTIKFWDTRSGRELRTLVGHAGYVTSIAFSPDGRMLASGSIDGSIKLWDVSSGKELVSLLSVDKDDWLVITPEGFFDGSPGAWTKILWRFSENLFDVVPVEAFFSEFYYPNLLTDIFEGKRPRPKTDIAKLDRRQPELKISSAASLNARNVTVKIEVSNAEAGVRDVRFFRDGSLVKAWRGEVALDKEGKAKLETTVPIVAGENNLTAYAFNHDNIKSEDATLTITGADSLRRQGTAYVLAVGVNSYANSQYNLKYAVADAKDFGEEFRQQQMKLGRFANVEVVSLADKDATKANILLALKKLAGSDSGPAPPGTPSVLQSLHAAQPEDAVVVYFAGHGTAQQNKFFLVPHDLGYQGSRTQLDRSALDTILAHSISDRELEEAFEQVDAGQILFVIDACNSGQALEAEEKRRGPMNSKGLAQLAYEKGMYILTAAQSYQAALETPQHGHGYLTYALVEEGLKTANADTDPRDGQVTVREWLDYATRRVPQLQEEDARRPKQTVATTQEQIAQQKPQRTTRQQRGRQGAKTIQQQEADKARQFERAKQQTPAAGTSEEKFLQQPRVFYRREVESRPLVVARPN
jgi:WD40 repeat protein/uncharacterized caspase-like protein